MGVKSRLEWHLRKVQQRLIISFFILEFSNMQFGKHLRVSQGFVWELLGFIPVLINAKGPLSSWLVISFICSRDRSLSSAPHLSSPSSATALFLPMLRLLCHSHLQLGCHEIPCYPIGNSKSDPLSNSLGSLSFCNRYLTQFISQLLSGEKKM